MTKIPFSERVKEGEIGIAAEARGHQTGIEYNVGTETKISDSEAIAQLKEDLKTAYPNAEFEIGVNHASNTDIVKITRYEPSDDPAADTVDEDEHEHTIANMIPAAYTRMRYKKMTGGI